MVKKGLGNSNEQITLEYHKFEEVQNVEYCCACCLTSDLEFSNISQLFDPIICSKITNSADQT